MEDEGCAIFVRQDVRGLPPALTLGFGIASSLTEEPATSRTPLRIDIWDFRAQHSGRRSG